MVHETIGKCGVSSLQERLAEILRFRSAWDAEPLAERILREIETTHRIIEPECVTEEMLEACFGALPKHYSPPDSKRRLWHGYKARHRYTAMVKAAPRIIQ